MSDPSPVLEFQNFREEWREQAMGVLLDYHWKRCGLIEARQAHHFLKALEHIEKLESELAKRG